MKYFTNELFAMAGVDDDRNKEQREQADQRFCLAVEAYNRELELLKSRLSKRAWYFFRHGFAKTGLHDGRLLSFSIGDGMGYKTNGKLPFKVNSQKTRVRIEFINYEQTLHYVFELHGLRRANMNLFVDQTSRAKSIGDLHSYELTGAEDEDLELGFLFATGAEMNFEFRRLVFSKHRIRRKYSLDEIY